MLVTEEVLKSLKHDAVVSSTLAILRIKDSNQNISSEYLEQVINSDKFKKYCAAHFSISNISNISKGLIDKFEVPIPSSKEELETITGVLVKLNKLNELIFTQIEQVNNIKNGVIQDLY